MSCLCRVCTDTFPKLHEPDSDHVPDHTVKKVTRSTRTKKMAEEEFIALSSDDEDDIALSIALEVSADTLKVFQYR